MTMETPKFQSTPDQIIEGKFGKKPIEEAGQTSRTIFEQIKAGILNIGTKEGASQEQQGEVKRHLEIWREFANGLFARTSSDNAKSPEVVRTAIDGANALLAVEPTGDKSAQKMIEALKQRY